MEPVTAAIVAAIAAGATQVSKSAVVDGYNGLKKLIQDKYKNTELPVAVTNLETRPDSKNRQGMVQEEVEITKADKDPDIMKAVQALTEALKETPEGQKAIGKFNIQADNIQGVVQADKIDNLTQTFGNK